jgi:hypothetical protein
MDEEVHGNARGACGRLTRVAGAGHCTRASCGLGCLIYFLVITSPAFGQFSLELPTTRARVATAPATMPAADLTACLADLRNADSAVRERARAKLMGMSRHDLETLQTVVAAAAPLNPSQTTHLREIVTHAFLATESYAANKRTGFLGVKDLVAVRVKLGEPPVEEDGEGAAKLPGVVDPVGGADEEGGSGDTGVIISERMPGFCGYRYLDNGDVILAIKENQFAKNDLVVRTRTVRDLQSAIRSHEPGDTITLQVLRRGKTIDIAFVLDAFPQAALEGLAIDDFRRDRENAAQSYWDAHFGPMLGQHVS